VRFGTLSGRLVLVREHAALDVGEASGGRFPADVTCALERWEELRAWASQADWSPARPLDEAALGPPVPLPRQVFAVALNYRPHAAEAGFAPPSEPLIFTKFPSCITGPYGSIALPDGRVDWKSSGVDDLVARLSRVCRLLPGDLIFTGTPAGVGNRRNPPRYLADGDVLVSRFERIGEIRQSFAR
jgi:2-keto-4-pentenoate hydratase/2-oxohepta-3-ene-1,7-dioic acid hydratase in catechol pathway